MIFDENGQPNDELKVFGEAQEEAINGLFARLIHHGATAVEIKAVAEYLISSVTVQSAWANLEIKDRNYNQKRLNADPNLSDEEMSFARNPNQKIEAIRQYRNRTGRGLKESKEAVEAWIRDNMGTGPVHID